MGKRKFNPNNKDFFDSVTLNNLTYLDYVNRFRKIALSVFEWINLPKSMNADYIEKCLYYYGQCAFLKDKRYGFINTQASDNGNFNIYGLPTSIHCYAYDYQTNRALYTGLGGMSEEQRQEKETSSCILVKNNIDRMPTSGTLELYAYRLYEAEMTAFTNIRAQKTPILIIVDEKQRLMLENLYSQFEGNKPAIFGDKLQLDPGQITALKTDAPFIADKIMEYKKEIWNEALTFLGINNLLVDKKERLITDEANSNNELINLNLQSYLAPRKQACKEFNEKFGFINTDKAIDVKIRSDLHNIIKNVESVVQDHDGIEELKDNLINLKDVDKKRGEM